MSGSEKGALAFAVERLTKRFGGETALRDVSLGVYSGEVHAIMGENGAGKSTLIKLLAGIHQPDEGSILINGERIQIENSAHSHSLGFGFLHQDLSLVDDLSIAENLFLGRSYPRTRVFSIDWKAVDRSARAALKLVGLNLDPSVRVGDLTSAQQQLVALARVLDVEPNVIVLDEPTASLGLEEAEHLLHLVETRREEGHTIVFISHRIEEVLRLADTVTVLRDGRHVTTEDHSNLTPRGLVHLLGGHAEEPDSSIGTRRAKATEPRLEVLDLGGPGLDNPVTTSIDRGEVVGLAGLVGSGRSTFARMLVGLAEVTNGQIRIDGKACTIQNPRDASRYGIAYVPSDRRKALVPTFSIRQNLTLGNIGRYSWRRVVIRHRMERRTTQQSIDRFSIKASGPDMMTHHLSGGNQQKVVLSRALDLKPSVLILDEPTAGIDIGTKQEIYNLVRDLGRRGTSIIVISSELEELPLMVDRILMFSRGRIVGELPGNARRADMIHELFRDDSVESSAHA